MSKTTTRAHWNKTPQATGQRPSSTTTWKRATTQRPPHWTSNQGAPSAAKTPPCTSHQPTSTTTSVLLYPLLGFTKPTWRTGFWNALKQSNEKSLKETTRKNRWSWPTSPPLMSLWWLISWDCWRFFWRMRGCWHTCMKGSFPIGCRVSGISSVRLNLC